MEDQADEGTEETVADGIRFRDLGLCEATLSSIERSGYLTATPIQARAIPALLAGRDVLGQAQTGTGKTAAFALPLLERIDLSVAHPQILVLTPTRELAIQVAESFDKYGSGQGRVRTVALYGGQDYQVQFRGLHQGGQVVVGTPGRVMDHIRRGTLKLDSLVALVLDEADEMLKMGFADDVEWVLTQTPATRQIALFSATMPDAIRRIAQQHLSDPVEITIEGGSSTAETVRQRYLVVPASQKKTALLRVLETEPVDGVMVFVRTKSATEFLAEFLSSQGFRVAALSSDIAQKQRERIVDHLRMGRLDVIVATDVAARGLDVPRISHVINYDAPFDTESYVHRIGRTGRAGREGDAILLLGPKDRPLLRRIERAISQPIEPMEVPTRRQVNQVRVTRFHERITAARTRPDLATFTSVIEQYRQQNPDVAVEEIAAALAGLVVGETPLFLTEDFTANESGPARSRRDEESGSPAGGFGPEPGRKDRSRRPENGSGRPVTGPMEAYRIEVGRNQGANPGQIVAAIAGGANLSGSHIGRITLFDDHSVVEMLAGMPRDTFETLRRVIVAGQPLNLSPSDRPARPERNGADGPGFEPRTAPRADRSAHGRPSRDRAEGRAERRPAFGKSSKGKPSYDGQASGKAKRGRTRSANG